MDGKDKPNTSYLRRVNKPLMERKRRERINVCLDQIKNILVNENNKENRCQKLEKADILEMTVRHLKSLRTQQLSQSTQNDGNTKREDQQSRYSLGYKKCFEEVDKFLGQIENNFSPQVKQTLLNHLHTSFNKKLQHYGAESLNQRENNSKNISNEIIAQNFNHIKYIAHNKPTCVNIAPKPLASRLDNRKLNKCPSSADLSTSATVHNFKLTAILNSGESQISNSINNQPNFHSLNGNICPFFLILSPHSDVVIASENKSLMSTERKSNVDQLCCEAIQQHKKIDEKISNTDLYSFSQTVNSIHPSENVKLSGVSNLWNLDKSLKCISKEDILAKERKMEVEPRGTMWRPW